jgi:hypothetical protein
MPRFLLSWSRDCKENGSEVVEAYSQEHATATALQRLYADSAYGYYKATPIALKEADQ